MDIQIDQAQRAMQDMVRTINKDGPLYRDFQVRKADIDKTNRTVALSFSSEVPVARWFGDEILDHGAKSVDLRRLKRGGALLIDHEVTNQVGVIEDVSIDQADRKGRALVRFGRSAKAEEIFQDVIDEIRTNVSVGYQIDEMVLEKEVKDGPSTYRVTRWTPFEVSLVSVPADIEVGVGRQLDLKKTEPKPEPKKEVRVMNMCNVCGAELGADGKCTGAKHEELAAAAAKLQTRSMEQMEKDRLAAIRNLCRINNLNEDYYELWRSNGSSLNQVADDLIKIFEERGKTNPQPLSMIGMSQKEAQRFSLVRAINACAQKDWKDAGLELEASQAVSKKLNRFAEPNTFFVPFEVLQRPVQRVGAEHGMYRDATAGTTSAGGYLVETQNVGFVELLRNRTVCMRMGARLLSGLQGNVTIPRQSAASTAYWLTNEATQATETNLTFAQISLSPKNVAAYVEVSRQLLLQSSPGAEGIVADDLAQQIAIAADLSAMEGSGSPQPTGIASTSGIGSVSGTTLGYAGILGFQTSLANSNVMPLRGGYVTTPTVAALMMQRQRFTSTDTPLWTGNLWDGAMAGFPAMSSNQLTAASMIFGDWQELILAEWGVLEVAVNPFANFQAGIIGVRAFYSMDVGVRRAFAFARATSIT